MKIFNDLSFESVTSYFMLIEILFLKYMEYEAKKEKVKKVGIRNIN